MPFSACPIGHRTTWLIINCARRIGGSRGHVSNGQIFLYETLGTAMLLLLGCGVVATAILRDSKGFGGGWLLINFGWGLGVYAGVYVAFPTGAHLNPAVTVSQWMMGNITAGQVDRLLRWRVPRRVPRRRASPGWPSSSTSTSRRTRAPSSRCSPPAPAIRNYGWNLVTEIIGTFVLIFVILISGGTPTEVGPLFVALLVVGIGTSLGGPTGYAINPARDLGPRIAHAVLPIKGKGSSDWGYSWVPVVGPIIGAIIATLVFQAIGAQNLIDAVTAAAGQ